MADEQPRTAPGPARAVLVALGSLVAALLAGLLWYLAGSRSPSGDPEIAAWERDPRFFVARDGQLVSHHPNMPPVAFPAEKEAAELRVFVLGGSQAMGDPYVHGRRALAGYDLYTLELTNTGGLATWLDVYLRMLHPDREVRVVNAAMGDQSLATAVRALEELAANASPDLAIVLSGNNEIFQARFASREEFDETVESLTATYAEGLEDVAALAEARGLTIYLLTVPTNARDWLPSFEHQPVAKSRIDEILANDHASLPPDEALQTLKSSRHALYDFIEARSLLRAGEYERAYERFRLAKDNDYNLIRAHSAWNELVMAAAGRSVFAFDLEAAMRDHATDRIPGYDLFHDHCHMRIRANMLAAKEVALFHARTAGLQTVELEDLDVEEPLRASLAKLYAIKERKWRRFNELSQFDRLGEENKQNVQRQFEAAKEEMDRLDRKIAIQESDLEAPR